MIVRIEGDVVQRYDLNDVEPVYAYDDEGYTKFLDGTTGHILEVAAGGTSGIAIEHLGRERIVNAFRMKSSWAIVRTSSENLETGTLEIWEYGSTGPVITEVMPIADQTWLSGSADGELITVSLSPPFRLSRVSPEGTSTPMRTVEQWASTNLRDGDSVMWVATMPVWLDADHVLLTFADLRSDARVLVRHNVISGAFRTRLIDVPLAFLASDPFRQHVIAFRDTFGGDWVFA